MNNKHDTPCDQKTLTPLYPKSRKYLDTIQYLFSPHQLLHATIEIETTARESGWDTSLEKKYNDINQEITNIMLSSEQSCALKETGLVYQYWNLRARYFHDLPVSFIQLQSPNDYIKISNETIDISQIVEQQKVSRREY